MLYVEVVIGLPLEGVFDYSVPRELSSKVAIGKRVIVHFRNQKKVAYIVNIKDYSPIKNIKSIYEVIDELPILDRTLLKLSRMLSEYYYCYLGEAVELILPKALREGKKIEIKALKKDNLPKAGKKNITLIQDLEGKSRWEIYLERIRDKLNKQQAIIFLVPEVSCIEEIARKLKENFNEEVVFFHSRQSDRINLLSWQRVKNNEVKIAVGTRMAVFLPFSNLGLIIMDEENNPHYREEQRPYYHSRQIAMMRAELQNIQLILSDISPSIEALYMAKKKKVDYLRLERKCFPQIDLIDTGHEPYSKKKMVPLSYPLGEFLKQALENKEKVLIFLNKKGFSTFIYCPHCRKILKCPRCDLGLVYHFREKVLLCHYCNYKTPALKICPDCDSSYIRYLGAGTEKIESRLSLFYPNARILNYNKGDSISLDNMDFLVSTEAIFRSKLDVIDSVAVVSLDNLLNRVDFRASEYTFYTLLKLLKFNPKRLFIQTDIPRHQCFIALKNRDINIFYNEELNLRKQLGLPPIQHLGIIKIKGENKEKVRTYAEKVFRKLKKKDIKRDIRVVSCFPHTPIKVRDNYIWQIMLKAKSAKKLNLFLKKELKRFRLSKATINVEID